MDDVEKRLFDSACMVFASLGSVANQVCSMAKSFDPCIKGLMADGEDITDSMDVLATRVAAETIISLHLNPYALFYAIYSRYGTGIDSEWFDWAIRPICDKAIELAREEPKHSMLWRADFFSDHGDDLLALYASSHHEAGLGIPTESQWVSFLDELDAEGEALRDAGL